jgi:glycerol-3-phosphate O-acyltransferase 3/4
MSLLEAAPQAVPALFEVAMPVLRQGCTAMVDDSFTRCFKSQKRVPWNWNCYLFPAWIAGLFFRYFILFPLRLLCLIMGFLLVAVCFPLVKLVGVWVDLSSWEVFLIQMLATAFVASWSGVIRIHGVRPQPRPGQAAGIFVANHSSMIDFIILLMSNPYAVVGQKHPGWVGFLQVRCSSAEAR